MIRRTITTLGIAALLVFQSLLPALAYGSDSGTVVCGSNDIAVTHRTYDYTVIQVPSGTTIDTRDYDDYTTSTTTTLIAGTKTWRVLSWEGGVDASATYAFCWGN